jgi:hypothetical protein
MTFVPVFPKVAWFSAKKNFPPAICLCVGKRIFVREQREHGNKCYKPLKTLNLTVPVFVPGHFGAGTLLGRLT